MVDSAFPADWETRFAATGKGTQSACADRPPATAPRTAVCITGAARSFSSPLVLAGLRHHLLPALGPRVRLFMQLKSLDSDKREGWFGQYRQHRENVSSVGAMLRALRSPWLARLSGEATIIDGNGSYLGPELGQKGVHGTMPRIVPFDDSMHIAYRPGGECATYMQRYRERQLLMYLGMEWCHRAIVRHEAARDVRFDAVMLTRPDLVWWTPPTLWCQWDPGRTTVLSAKIRETGSDQVWSVPRDHAKTFLGLADRLRSCTVQACCADAESIQSRVVAKAGDSLTPAEAGVRSSFRTNTKSGPTLLRAVQGVCEVALHPYYLDGRMAFNMEREGPVLPIKTGVQLRRLFFGENATKKVDPNRDSQFGRAQEECHQALASTRCGRKTRGLKTCGWGEKFR